MAPLIDEARLRQLHARLMEEIRHEAADTQAYTGRAAFSEMVMNAMDTVDRRCFLPEEAAYTAYVNRPLPLDHGQTISQPYIVALMTDLLGLAPGDRVLEVGTGSGYQAAVLAQLAAEIYSIETVEDLARSARRRLHDLGYANIHVRHGDGWQGWPDEAPFDGIIVTAAPEESPPRLVDQLAPGGRLVVPVGRVFETQTLMLCIKDAETGELRSEPVLPVAFVPMVKPKV